MLSARAINKLGQMNWDKQCLGPNDNSQVKTQLSLSVHDGIVEMA